jgi:hypothetical protein
MLGRGFMSWPFFLPLFTNVVEGVFSEVALTLVTLHTSHITQSYVTRQG